MPVYQRNPEALPDSRFEAGQLGHLVAGNEGRLLDPRRTPVRLVGFKPEAGLFVVEILDFEDKGARWETPFEEVGLFQFARGSREAGAAERAAFRQAIERLDRPLFVPADPARRKETLARLAEETLRARGWLETRARLFREKRTLDLSTRDGDPLLREATRAFFSERDLWPLEEGFADRWVSSPRCELVKGHRLVLAGMGLVPYEGKVPRDPALFEGPWSRENRARHILARLAFVRAFFGLAGIRTVTLYRGIASDGPVRPPSNQTFVSATFSREVAEALAGASPSKDRLLQQALPVERIFMSFLETGQMNRQFREAEAVLLHDPGNPLF